MIKKLAFAGCAALLCAATPSYAALTLDLSCTTIGKNDINPNASACVGYYDKNVLKSSAGDNASADEVTALNLLGLTGTIKVLEKLDGSGDFSTLLNGITYVGVHYGNFIDPNDGTQAGNVTAFYKFDAGTNLDSITFASGSVSGVSLYFTGGAVPEPAAWAMMVIGFGIVGAAVRRRKMAVSLS